MEKRSFSCIVKSEVLLMPIDPKIVKLKAIVQHNGHGVRNAKAPKLGVHGDNVAVDQDLCIGCGSCKQVCPINVYDMIDVAGKQKSDPVRQKECIECRACEAVCPVKCILISPK
jgi:NAD-dependent dihydropyrimidine dehydrogenase PreA subunit